MGSLVTSSAGGLVRSNRDPFGRVGGLVVFLESFGS